MHALIPGLSRTRRLVCCLALLLGLLGTLGPGQVARAATLTVTTTTDELNADGDCSLREAVRAANLDTAVDACAAGSGADTIMLPAGTYMLTLYSSGADNAALEDDLDLLGTVTIAGADARTTVIDTSTFNRLFEIRSGAQVSISEVTLRGAGSTYGWYGAGGGILNSGTLTVTNSAISDNKAVEYGGGIYNTGKLTLNNSLVSNNLADDGEAAGGGIWNSGMLTLNNTTVSGNHAVASDSYSSKAGGIYSMGTLTLANSTITRNIARNGTVQGNATGDGGGIVGTFTARNSIIADNEGSDIADFPDCYGTFVSEGVNVLGIGCTSSGTGTVLRGAPNLAPLADNGGPTPTHAPRERSIAVDAGDPAMPGSSGSACLATDQRGVTRPQDGDGDGIVRCDVGAVENKEWLLANGGFERDINTDGTPDSWSADVRARRSSAVVHRGSYALRHQASDNGSYTIFSDPVVPVVAGTPYRFAGWVNIPATSDAFSFELQVRWRDSNGNVISTVPVQMYTAATNGWSSTVATLAAPPNAAQATIRQVVGSLNATVYVDDLRLRPVYTLLWNSGFESAYDGTSNPRDWSSSSYSSQSNAVVHSGSYALRHQASDNGSYTVFSHPSEAITAGTTYSFAGWVNIPATSDAFSFELQVRWRDSNGNVISTVPVQTYTAATNGWSSATATLVAPPNAAQATIRQVVGSLNATIYVDDIVLGP